MIVVIALLWKTNHTQRTPEANPEWNTKRTPTNTCHPLESEKWCLKALPNTLVNCKVVSSQRSCFKLTSYDIAQNPKKSTQKPLKQQKTTLHPPAHPHQSIPPAALSSPRRLLRPDPEVLWHLLSATEARLCLGKAVASPGASNEKKRPMERIASTCRAFKTNKNFDTVCFFFWKSFNIFTCVLCLSIIKNVV